MAGETYQTLHIIDEAIVDEAKTASRAESDVPVASSSSNVAAAKMTNKTNPVMSEYWKKSTVTEADRCHTTKFQILECD
jgi:hypothetical protein